jgi:O-antigen/teichoic acid export membrane protein
MSRYQFVSTLIWLVILNLLVKTIFIFGIDLQVQQQAGASAYGLYFTLLNLCYIFQIINDFGLNQLHNTDTAASGSVLRERWHQMLRLKLGLSIIYAFVIVGVAAALGYLYAWKLLIWLIVNNVLVSLILLLRAGISGTGRYKTEAVISVLDKGLMILICGSILLQSSAFKIEWFVWAQTASLVITAIVAWMLSRNVIVKVKEVIADLKFRSLLKETLPFTFTVFLMFIYTRADSVMIEQLLEDGTYAVGVYAAGFRLLDAANMIAFLFSPLLIPMYVKLRQNHNEINQLMSMATGMMVVMSGIISIGCFFWAEPIMKACYPNANETWITTFKILILCHIPVGLMYIYSSYLTAIRELKKQNTLFIGSVLMNIILNFLLIPTWGTVGAAVAALATQTMTTAGLIIISQIVLHEKIAFSVAIRAVGFYILLVVIAFLLSRTNVQWTFAVLLFIGIAVGAAFGLRLLQWKSLLDVIRRREQLA